MHLLTAVDVERIYRQTDELELHRDWVVVPLNYAEIGMELEMVLPDGRLLLRPPGKGAFESWLHGLAGRLDGLGLSRIPRRAQGDPSRILTGMDGPPSSGTRGYLAKQPDLNVLDDHPSARTDNDGG